MCRGWGTRTPRAVRRRAVQGRQQSVVLLVVPRPLPTPWTVGRRSPAQLEGAAAVVSHYRDMRPAKAAPVADANAFNQKTSGCGACAVLMRQGWNEVREGTGGGPGRCARGRCGTSWVETVGSDASCARGDMRASARFAAVSTTADTPPCTTPKASACCWRRRRCRHQREDGGRSRVRDACAWGTGGKVMSLNSGECLHWVVSTGERNTSRQTELSTGQSRLEDRFPNLRKSPASLFVQRRPHHPYVLDRRAGASSC